MKNDYLLQRLFQWKQLWTFILWMLLSGTIVSYRANAQKYVRSVFNDTYVPITIIGGATESTATGDNSNQTGIPLGFNFIYADSLRSVIGLNTNGLVWFDAVAPSASDGSNISRMYSTSGANEGVGAWFANMQDDASSQILYQTQGVPGSQTFTVQYTNYPHYSGAAGLNIRINFQVVFYEGSNVIEFRYGAISGSGPAATAGGACIAIEYGAGGAGNFLDLVTGSGSTAHGMLSPLMAWPTNNFRLTPGVPVPVTTGVYNVGVGQTFSSLSNAVAELNHRGISGPVTLNLVDENYDITAANGNNIFPILVGPVEGTSSTNTLTISKSGTPATLSYKGSPVVSGGFGSGSGLASIIDSQEPIVGVCASYTTISNVNLVSLGTSSNDVEIGLMVFEAYGGSVGAQHNLFDKISIDMDRTNTGTIAIFSNSISNPGGLAGSNSYNIYRDITIRDSYAGINLQGSGGVYTFDNGNQIVTSSCTQYNSIGDPNNPSDLGGGSGASYGIWLQNQENFIVKNNFISSISTSSNTSSVDGIWVPAGAGINDISNNIIRNLKRNNSTLNSASSVSGIRVASPNALNTFRIYNNNISGLELAYTGAPTLTRGVRGIYIDDTGAGAVTYEVWNNSVSIDGSTFPNASSACFEIEESGVRYFLIKNNVFANFTSAQTLPAGHFAFVAPDVDRFGSLLSQSDFNNLYVANDLGVSGHIGLGSGTLYSTLAAWQSGMSFHPGTDANSQNADPHFVNNLSDLHGTSLSVSLDGTGTSIPSFFTTDIDCQTRSNPTDIGADDFTICNSEAGTVSPVSAAICEGAVYTIVATGFSSDPSISYQWKIATIQGGPYTNVVSNGTATSYTTEVLSPGTYYFVMETTCNGSGSDLTNEFELTVFGNPSPVISSSGATIFCSGGAVTLDAGVYTSYDWSNGSSSQTIAISQSGTFAVTVTDANGCSATSASITVTVNPLPAVSLGSFPNACLADPEFTLSGGNPVGGIYSGPGVNNGNFNPAIAGIGLHIITYTFTDGNGCSNTDNASIEVIDCGCNVPNPIAAISGPGGVCQGQNNITFSVANDPSATSYIWTLPSGLSGSSSTNTISVNASPSYTNSNICVVAVNGCGQTTPYCRLVSRYTVKPSKPGVISGPVYVCDGSSKIYSVPASNNVAVYTWSVPAGATILNGQGTNQIEVVFGMVSPGSKISVTGSNCIGTSAARILSVLGPPPMPEITTGNFPVIGVCGGNTYSYKVNNAYGASAYQWTAPLGAIISDGLSSSNPLTTANSIVSITFPSGFLSGEVKVAGVNSCGAGVERVKTVRALTGTPNPISGDKFAVCGESGQTYSILPVSGATSYVWTMPPGAVINGPTTGNTVTIDFSPTFTIGSICVSAVNSCGNSQSRCLTVQGRPGPANSIVGPVTVCNNATPVQYEVPPFNGAISYLWTASNSAAVSGTTEVVSVNFDNVVAATSELSVKGINACGTSDKSVLVVNVDNCRLSQSTKHSMEIFPNPANHKVQVSFYLTLPGSAKLIIRNLQGKDVLKTEISGSAGYNNVMLDISHLAPGTYIISGPEENINTVQKLIVY